MMERHPAPPDATPTTPPHSRRIPTRMTGHHPATPDTSTATLHSRRIPLAPSRSDGRSHQAAHREALGNRMRRAERTRREQLAQQRAIHERGEPFPPLTPRADDHPPSEAETEEVRARVVSWLANTTSCIDPDAALRAAYATLTHGRAMDFLWCPHCAEPILDSPTRAAHPQKTHQCGTCGRRVSTVHTFAANPLAVFRPRLVGSRITLRSPEPLSPPPRPLPLDPAFREEDGGDTAPLAEDPSSSTITAVRPTPEQDRVHEALVGLRDLMLDIRGKLSPTPSSHPHTTPGEIPE